MSSRSSSSGAASRVTVGRVSGRRGIAGELTVRVFAGEADAWGGLRRVEIERGDGIVSFDVEHARAYRDRLVLKLREVDSAGAAEALRGGTVSAALADAPALAPGEYWVEMLVGLEVFDADGTPLGRVRGVTSTGGADLLQIDPAGDPAAIGARRVDDEMLIPLAREVVEIDIEGRRIVVHAPEGLLDLNRGARR